MVVAGDNLFSEPLGDFGRVAREHRAPLLAIHDVGDLELVRGRYNSIEIDANGRITYFEEKPEEPRSTLSGIALYFYPRDMLPLIREYLAGGENLDQPGLVAHPVARPARRRLHLARARPVGRHR